MLANPTLGLWTYLFGVSSLTFDPSTSHASKALRLNSDGNCPLFDSLQTCVLDDVEKQAEVWSVISDIRSSVLWDDSYTDDQRMVFTHEKLHGFFVRHSDLLDVCANVDVYNGINIEKFIRIGKLFKQMHNLRKVLGGSPSLVVEYLSILQNEPSLNSSTIREQIRLMVDNLDDHFLTEQRIFKRLEYVAIQTVELLNPQNNGIYLEIDLGSWGRFDDLLSCYAYYKQHGWHETGGPNETAPHCTSSQFLIRLNPDNRTLLTDAIEQGYKRWGSISYRADFKGYFKRIQNIIRGRMEGLTTAQKLVEISKVLNGFSPIGNKYEELMSIEIPAWRRTIKDFIQCQNVPTNDLV